MKKIDVIKNEFDHIETYFGNGREIREFSKTLTYGGYTVDIRSYWIPQYCERTEMFKIELDINDKTFFIY